MEEKFINECTEMGFEYTDIKDFIEDKGLPVLSHDLLTDCINQQRYHNPLYTKPDAQGGQQSNVNFGYYDPAMMAGGQPHPQGYFSQAPMGAPMNKVAPVRNQRHPQNQYLSQPAQPVNMYQHAPSQNSSMMQDEDQKLCKICLVTNIDTVSIPCGHRSMCNECSQGIMRGNKQCPICRAKIQQIVKTFDA